VSREILFRVSSEAAAVFDHWEVDWSNVGAKYKAELHARVQAAKQTAAAMLVSGSSSLGGAAARR
jgi:uncharacterized protein YeaO (DUF488 family)